MKNTRAGICFLAGLIVQAPHLDKHNATLLAIMLLVLGSYFLFFNKD